MLREGQRVKFKRAFFQLSNDELELEGLTGVVLCAERCEVRIRLDVTMPDLREWDNQLIWDSWDALSGLAALVEVL